MADEEFVLRLLGPVRIRRDGVDRPLGSGLRSAVLVVLALAGEATRDQLIAAVWGEDPPPSAGSNVYTHVNALRETLGGEMLVRENGAYRLRVTEGTVDARRFEALREQARQHRASGRRSAERAALDRALSLWDGEALAGVPGPYADAQRARLRELRIASEHAGPSCWSSSTSPPRRSRSRGRRRREPSCGRSSSSARAPRRPRSAR